MAMAPTPQQPQAFLNARMTNLARGNPRNGSRQFGGGVLQRTIMNFLANNDTTT
jgi:hypothetical protein